MNKIYALSALFTIVFCSLHAQTDYCLKFEAGDNVKTIESMSWLDNTSSFTIEVELSVDSITSWTHLISRVDNSTKRISLQYHQGKLYGIVSNGSNSYKYTSTATIAKGVRYHVAMVYNGLSTNKIDIYIDGVSQALTKSSANLPSNTPSSSLALSVGHTKFKGKMDELRIWNQALSGSRIDTWKDSTLTANHPDISNLKIYWNFDDNLSTDTAHASLTTSINGLINGAQYMLDTNSTVIQPDTSKPGDTIVGGYMPYYKIKKVSPDIFDHLTHLYYFSLGPNANGELGRVNGSGTFTPLSNIPSVVTDLDTLKAWRGSKTTKIFLVVGGWVQSDYFDEAVSNSITRQQLATNIKDFCLLHNLDGVDIDWEGYKGAVNDNNYGLFLNDLKSTFGSTNLQISVAINPSHTSLADEFMVCDFIQLMSYGPTFGQNTQVPLSKLKSWVQGWTISGFPRAKIVVGLPAFGRTPSNGSSVTYRDMLRLYNLNANQDAVMHNGVTYYINGITTVKQKTQYAVDNYLNGVMFWELGQDTLVTDSMSLLRAVNQIIPVNTQQSNIGLEEVDKNQSLFIYPNPATAILNIEALNNIEEVNVFNLSGQKVYECIEDCEQIDLSTLLSGMYLIHIKTVDKDYLTKVIKD